MRDDLLLTGRKSIGPLKTLVSALLLFSPPAMASGASILALPVFGVKGRLYKPVGLAFLLLCMTSVFAVIASYMGVGEIVFKDLKFLFMGTCLLAGFWAQAYFGDIRRLAAILAILLVVWFAITRQSEIYIPPEIYPPDNNLSAITIFFLGFIVSERTKLPFRLGLMALLLLFSSLSDSRLLMILLPLFLLSQPISVSFRHVIALVFVICVIFFWSLSANLWGSWSDVVRIEIYTNIWTYFSEHGLPLFARGEDNFIYDLNLMLPEVISRRIELNHAHNAFAQVLGSYGLLAGLSFVAAAICLISIGYKLKDETLRNQMIFLAAAMMVETVISDSRAAYIIFLFVGLQAGSAFRRSAMAGEPGS